jgi:hypothetical protein
VDCLKELECNVMCLLRIKQEEDNRSYKFIHIIYNKVSIL